jgi:phosphate:Na+ symporter
LQAACALDKNSTGNPTLALASLRREILRMGQIVEVMIRPVMELYQSGDIEKIKSIKHLDKGVNLSLTAIRRYVASLDRNKMTKKNSRLARELTEYAISLETAGDVVAKRLLVLAEKYNVRRLKFSDNGWAELVRIHERVVANTTLAFNVLVSEDIESARLLIEEKTEMATLERKSRNKHLKRLRSGDEISFESSDVHLETLRALKDFNSQISAVAYPILYRSGQLLETRLVENPELGDEIEKSK